MDADYKKLKLEWRASGLDREQSLHLLFLSWMHWADPPFVTGMAHDPEAVNLWHEIYGKFGGLDSDDAEFLYVAGLMAHLFPYALGDEKAWEEKAVLLKKKSREKLPVGFSPEDFEGRGDYGEYFAMQAKVSDDFTGAP